MRCVEVRGSSQIATKSLGHRNTPMSEGHIPSMEDEPIVLHTPPVGCACRSSMNVS